VTCAVYLIGGPGTGKSTVMYSLMQGWKPGEYVRFTVREMFGHWLDHEVLGAGAYLGRLRPEFPGTDALSRSVQPHALTWVTTIPMLNLAWVFGEGERLGNVAFLTALAQSTRLQVVHLVLDPELQAERLEQRPGKALTPVYVKAKTTQAANVARQVDCIEVNANQETEDIVEEVLRNALLLVR
jgi:GTPase SAR1 family protein